MMHPDLSLAANLNRAPKSGKTGKERLKDLLSGPQAEWLGPLIARYEGLAPLLAGVAEGSPYLWRLIVRAPERLVELLTEAPEKSLARVVEQTLQAGEIADEAGAMRALRKAKAASALLLALADLGGVYDTVQVTHGLSDFADASVKAALRFGLRRALEGARLSVPDSAAPERDLGLFILALGKHGARELNYSSDIDLTIFYDPAKAGLASAGDAQKLAVFLVKTLVKLLNERTGDGYVQRVDLRLRPDPGMTPVALSVEAGLGYYESLGQNWERAAMIKARVVAGDVPVGEAFLKELTPFIWRKYFDYSAIADIHAMKRQIYAVKGHAEIVVPGHDLKVGRGGIREIEFFVQTQQLVYGGRRPSLRGSRTLEMLAALANEGWVTAQAARELDGAYRVLRDFEHRIQMVHDEQTQKLPKSDEDLATFARFCGYTRAGFDAALIKVMRTVERHYARLFETVPGLASQAGSLVFTGVEDDPATLETLRKLGFARPSQVAETVRGWHFGRRAAITTARAREILTELLPSLLEAFGASSDPDGALAAFDDALVHMRAAAELLSILKNNAELRRLFAEILGTAPRLSQMVARTPHVLDVLVDPAFTQGFAKTDAHARIAPRLERQADYELFLDLARELAHAERFLLGTRMLSRVLSVEDCGAAHTDLAETFLDLVLARTRTEFELSFGAMPGGEVILVGYGKAGSREMTANSDLDIVVIYDAPPEAESSGPRVLAASEYFARLTQRLITALSAPMRSGTLYEIDLRLRPSGRKGTVATSLRSFQDYQAGEAETWEHMALSRARPLVGDAALAKRWCAARDDILRRPRDAAAIRKDMAQMRALMHQSKPGRDQFDVKDFPGGLVDCEFIAQILVLLHAKDHPELIGPAGATLELAGMLGLISAAQAETVLAAWRLQTGFAQVTRLCLPDPFEENGASPVFRRRMASLLDLPDFAFLKSEIKRSQRAVRAIFEAIVGPVKA